MRSISKKRRGKTRRLSSYDRSGGNRDFFVLQPGDTAEIADIAGAGYITHVWATMAVLGEGIEVSFLPRKVVIQMYWDGAAVPSAEAPIGDFFGMGHGLTENFTSAYLMMSPEDGKAFNCYFPMPFQDGARIVVKNESEAALKFYFYVDYEQHDSIPDDELRFHARWNRECPTKGTAAADLPEDEFNFGGFNTTGEENYVILDIKGAGHYIGCNFNLHNLRITDQWNWYGEGDDMIFIDGLQWPPTLHGTGTEDYFNTAWGPKQEVCAPYHGIILGGGPNWGGKISVYRYHILDAVIFDRSIRVTIEHGHNNHRSDDISSTAYWYQEGINEQYQPLPGLNERMPRPEKADALQLPD